jgi:uncharacterized protein (DUF362 family)
MQVLLIKDIEMRGVKKKAGLIMEGTDDFCNNLINQGNARSLMQSEKEQIKTSKAKERFQEEQREKQAKIEAAKEKKRIELEAEKELEKETKPKTSNKDKK